MISVYTYLHVYIFSSSYQIIILSNHHLIKSSSYHIIILSNSSIHQILIKSFFSPPKMDEFQIIGFNAQNCSSSVLSKWKRSVGNSTIVDDKNKLFEHVKPNVKYLIVLDVNNLIKLFIYHTTNYYQLLVYSSIVYRHPYLSLDRFFPVS